MMRTKFQLNVVNLLNCVIILLPCIFCQLDLEYTKERLTKSHNIPSSIMEDADLQTDELITKYKYPAQKHYITTEDGYILGVHRIAQTSGMPFLLLHGFLDSSATFVLMGPDSALGYYLWDQGYDVWLGNVRGNRYSRNHTNLDPNKKKFWDFSYHEMGVHDLPAMIDYILENTKREKLFYIGHSQGCGIFFVMCTKRPEYQKKIILMHSMAPAVYLSHTKSISLTGANNLLGSPISELHPEIFPGNGPFRYFCLNEFVRERICMEILFSLFGTDYKEMNKTMLPVILGQIPAGVSLRTVRHHLQVQKSSKFRQYDYGPIRNLVKYGRNQPPLYNLSTVTTPVIIYYGSNDIVCTYPDIHRTYRELNNGIELYNVEYPYWTHIDFTWGIHAKEFVYEVIVNRSKSFA